MTEPVLTCPVCNEPCQSMCDEPCSWSGSKRRREDGALIQQLVEALCECAEDSQEQLDRMEAARLRDYKPNAVAWQEDTIAKAKAAITAGRARLEGFDDAIRRTRSAP